MDGEVRECKVLLIRVPRDSKGKVIQTGPVTALIATKEKVLLDKNKNIIYREWIETRPLPFYNKHSPDGFNIGYGGSGPAELAYSICSCVGARGLYQDFKFKVLAKLNRGRDYDIPFSDIIFTIDKLKAGSNV